MDYDQKATSLYKDQQADRTLITGEFGDCSKIPISQPVPRSIGRGPFDGALGTSIVGMQTSIALPNFDLTLDAGKGAESVLERNLIISHYDADHVEGIGRAVCNAINRKSKLDIFLPNMKDHSRMKDVISKFTTNDKERLVSIHEMDPGKVAFSEMLEIEPFKTNHSPESMGFTISKRNGKQEKKLVYTGDIDLSKERIGKDHPIRNAGSLIIDGSYTGIISIFNDLLDIFTSHTSTGEIKNAIKKNENLDNLGIVHVPLVYCADIESDLSSSFKNSKADIFLLKSCINAIFDNPINRFSTFEKVEKK